jgi:methylmalonyl-CoA mutase C-terminal domain/subunit
VGVPALVVDRLVGVKAIVAKLGMDAHWRGAIVVAHAFRNAGMEVVYLGHADAQAIVRAAVEEDALVIGLSTLSGNHLGEVPRVLAALREAQADDLAVVVGGTVSGEDARLLREQGVDEVFPTGSSLAAILARVAELTEHYRALREPT